MITEEMIAEITARIDALIEDKGYYNGKYLLEKAKGENRCTILISTTTRSIGKTSYYILFSYFLHKLYEKQTFYVVRLGNELQSYHLIYDDVLCYYGLMEEMKTTVLVRDALSQLHFGDGIIGYVGCLKKADPLKKFSSVFRNVELILMEEYQIEEGRIIRNEPDKLKSIIRTVGRGNGKIVREVLTVLLGNPVTLMNPYLIYYGIAPLYHGKDGFVRKNRICAEFYLENAASEMMKSHSIAENYHADYDLGKSFLYASDGFIRKCEGKTQYVLTIIYGQTGIGVRRGLKNARIYCTPNPDPNASIVMVLNPNDMTETRELLDRRSVTWDLLRRTFNNGNLFFANLKIKEIMFDLLGISVYN